LYENEDAASLPELIAYHRVVQRARKRKREDKEGGFGRMWDYMGQEGGFVRGCEEVGFVVVVVVVVVGL
jgi:hypothetical protein